VAAKKGKMPPAPATPVGFVKPTETPPEVTRESAPPVVERVKSIAGLMSAMEWNRTKSHELAKQWGLSIDTVQGHAAEASRIVSAAVMEPDHVRATVGIALERIMTDFDTSDRKCIVMAATAWSKISGAEAASKVELSTRVVEEFERMPVPERVTYLRDKAAALNALADQLEGKQ
jgi:hypothetical protein